MRRIVIIPARLASSRLPRKLLLPLGEQSILSHVYHRCLQAKGIDAVYIATDSEEIAAHCQHFTADIIMTQSSHRSGTDRIAEAAASLDAEVIVNVQGDEPFIDPALITEVAAAVSPDKPMSSAMRRIQHTAQLYDPSVVKVVVNHHNEALYFSRAAIPHYRDAEEALRGTDSKIPETLRFYQHIGIYGYHRDFLLTYSQMPPSYLEQLEQLEQLRVLEDGHTIRMIETAHEALGIDTAADYLHAQERIQNL